MEKEGNFAQGIFFGGILSLLLWFSLFGWINMIIGVSF